ncbi:MAG: hypothetical protein AUJ07_02765 [Crenarchaeota archaeon 13_1_40CM_3_53_5]|nr:MAG: hypothetical protein AUJ07_02765 [Crenarchaeota archaeon 13_1_40CM_3_53_5]
MTRRTVLVTTDLLDKQSVKRLSRHANVIIATRLAENELQDLLPSTDCLMVFAWPAFLTEERLARMKRLRFIQSILAGVNHIPFGLIDGNVIVCSNAGAYSDEVAEHAWGLLLAAAKSIVEQHLQIKEGRGVLVRHGDAARGITVLTGKALGILGYGGIGVSVARVARAFGMNVNAFSRKQSRSGGIRVFSGGKGLTQVLGKSDAVVLALPLNRLTRGIINKETLVEMKSNAILVNIGRGELVEERALFEHLKANPTFRFATDVWWYRNGKESLETTFPFTALPNFVGTLHVSGPSAVVGGRPVVLAVENTLRFLRGLQPKNIVKRSDYVN